VPKLFTGEKLSMKILKNKLVLSTLLLAALTGSSFAMPQQSAGEDMKDAGNATKDAAKDTGRATKKSRQKDRTRREKDHQEGRS
jgi:Ni/Co efflux regulator RcnB